jgi:hypothetical protein
VKRASIAQLCIGIGCLCAGASFVSDNFFDAPDTVTDPLIYGGMALMIVGLWLTLKQKQSILSNRDRRKRFIYILVAGGIASVVSFFGLRRKFPDFSMELQLGICAFVFLFCLAFFYWQFFMRGEK